MGRISDCGVEAEEVELEFGETLSGALLSGLGSRLSSSCGNASLRHGRGPSEV